MIPISPPLSSKEGNITRSRFTYFSTQYPIYPYYYILDGLIWLYIGSRNITAFIRHCLLPDASRYHRGGSIPDDQLTSAQVRARHGIPANREDFASRRGENDGGFPIAAIVAALFVVVILYLLMNKDTLFG